MSIKMLEDVYKSIQGFYNSGELVFGEGKPNAEIMLIGEAPGRDEVQAGRPFCGKAGRNLDEFLATISLPREDIFITNVCKFRPYKVSAKGTVSNRPPTRGEIEDALPFLYREITAVAPHCIVTLGNTPLRVCLGDFTAVIGQYHGHATDTEIDGRRYTLFALYHPASIIYNPALKAAYSTDLTALRAHIQNENN